MSGLKSSSAQTTVKPYRLSASEAIKSQRARMIRRHGSETCIAVSVLEFVLAQIGTAFPADAAYFIAVGAGGMGPFRVSFARLRFLSRKGRGIHFHRDHQLNSRDS
jgi:hypothetical protein